MDAVCVAALTGEELSIMPPRFPKADPHAAAGPNSSPRMTGSADAGRTSVSPGMMTMALKGMSSAA